MKTSELTGAALDWAVAKCEDKLSECTQASNFYELCKQRGGVAFTHGRMYSPSTDWAQGGPIIEREKQDSHAPTIGVPYWTCFYVQPVVGGVARQLHRQTGPTPLIAAMRCYVASKLGDTVDVPEELNK